MVSCSWLFLAAPLILSAGPLAAATFTANTTADLPDTNPGDGVCATTAFSCSLRAAIEEANATTTLDTIAFDVPGPGVHTFQTAAMPAVMQPIVIDGLTQPGSAPNTNATGGLNAVLTIELRGGLVFRAGNATVRGIVSNGGTLVFEAGPGTPAQSVVEGCYIGSDPTGTIARNGGFDGLRFVAPGGPLRVGGAAPSQRSLVTASAGARCIDVSCGATDCAPGSAIAGNLIGTNAAGTAALTSARGITTELAGGLVIGGTSSADGNLISGSGNGISVVLGEDGHPPIVIQGNRIGVDATGTQAIPNGTGIAIGCMGSCLGAYATIGGGPAAANLIARNFIGLSVLGGTVIATGNRISDNNRGVDVVNHGAGITAEFTANEIKANADLALWVRGTYGVAATLRGNEISDNGGGVWVEPGTLSSGYVRLEANSIHDNGGLGFDLGDAGATPNDAWDADGGPNELQNFPVLATACSGGPGVTVTGSLHTVPGSTATIELFRNPACDTSGHGEGALPAGTVAVTADGGGNASFSALVAGAAPGEFVTATATNAAGQTSEFGRCIRVDAPPPAQPIAGPSAVCSGTPFALEAAPGGTSHQWFLDAVAIPGATGPRYSQPAAGASNAGTYTVQATVCAATATSPPHGLAVAACGMTPVRLDVDVHPSVSNANGVLEAGESILIEPRYRNDTASPVTLTGTATLGGVAGGTYTLYDADASYGSVAPAQLADCFGVPDCYWATVAGTPRPRVHWDAALVETLSNGDPARHWSLHIGETFTDVLVTNAYYRFVETLIHNDVTAGCTEWTYCPASATTREQMAVFVLVAREPAGYRPAGCDPAAPRFADVPAGSPFCPWIEELARRGVVGGCGNGLYCPTFSVARDQMAVFVLATKEAPGYAPPPCVAAAEMFADVPAASPFCRWVEELARRNVVAGCGGGNYCPTLAVSREQMGVFLTVTFGLALYGP